MPHLVSLISDQPIPNLLFIKSVEQEVEGYIFISTSQMENKQRTHWLKKAADLPEECCRTIEVEAEKYYNILEKLKSELPADDRYLVNITGGNKLMMLACYQFFLKNTSNELYYLPIGGQSFQNMRSPEGHLIPVTYELNVWEYLTAHGIGFDTVEKTHHDFEKARSVMKLYRNQAFNRKRVMRELSLKIENEGDKNYLEGGWFEEYIYFFLKEELALTDDHIYLNVTFHPGEGTERNVNELDVIFVYRNELFIVEAKIQISDSFDPINNKYVFSVSDSKKLGRILYKLASINKGLGIRTNSMLMTLSNLSNQTDSFNTTLSDRLNTLNLNKPFDRLAFKTDVDFKEIIIKWVNHSK